MGFLQRIMPALPSVEADATTREAVEDRVTAALAGAPAERATALVAVRDELLWPASAAWRAKAPVDDGELGCEVCRKSGVAYATLCPREGDDEAFLFVFIWRKGRVVNGLP